MPCYYFPKNYCLPIQLAAFQISLSYIFATTRKVKGRKLGLWEKNITTGKTSCIWKLQ